MMHSSNTRWLDPLDRVEPAPDPVPDSQGSVMVIDDSMTVRTVVEACLRRTGVQVTSFGDGLAAMGALARGEVAVPDVVLLDIGLPKMDGYEVARILRSKPELGQTTIIMLTAHDGVLDRLRGKLVGASAYITKPFRVSHVVDVVHHYLLPFAQS
jgi:CheY-like chemotaxis protein